MKKYLLLLIFLFSASGAFAQYRALSFEANGGWGWHNNTDFVGVSSNFHWDFNDRYFIANWAGWQYDNDNPYQRWFANDFSINRYIANTASFGFGVQYRKSFVEDIDGLYFTFKIRKTFRFD